MEFVQLFFWEWIILLGAGFTLLGGKKGLWLTGAFLSIINLSWHRPEEFWAWELILLAGVAVGALGFRLVNRNVQDKVISGLLGGFISLLAFGAFTSPLAALVIWSLIVGTGLIPKLKGKRLIWQVLPTIWRTVMAIGWIVYGNLLYVL